MDVTVGFEFTHIEERLKLAGDEPLQLPKAEEL
jgi:hypothetical protein